MRRFFGRVFSTVVGLILFFGLLFLVFFLVIAGLSSSIESKPSVPDKAALLIKFNKPLMERGADDPLSKLDVPFRQQMQGIGVHKLCENLEKAAQDERIKGVMLDLRGFKGGMAHTTQVRDCLEEFKKSGKFVGAYGERYPEQAYYLASVADSVWLNPGGIVEFRGLRAELMFFKKTLEKLDLNPQVYRVGKFKSAVEPFIREDMSEANRKQVSTFLETLYGTYMEDIGRSRQMAPERLRTISDSLLVRKASDALDKGMVTRLAYSDQVNESLRGLLEVDSSKDDLPLVKYDNYKKATLPDADLDFQSDQIAVIVAEGNIVTGKTDDSKKMGSENIVEELRKARENDNVKAVVLRVNSPGGSALASEIMWREVRLTRKEKPVIASMGNLAASGGYYISMACDSIVAQRTSITGSIGVFGLLIDAHEFFENKLGITFDRVKTGAYSDLGTFSRPFKPEEDSIIQNEIERIYDQFVERAAEGRGMPESEMRKVAGGRVWAAPDAKRLGLVDVLGGLDSALSLAGRRAGLKKDQYAVKFYPRKKDFIERLTEKFSQSQARENALKAELGPVYEQWQHVRRLHEHQGIRAELPFRYRIE